MNRFLSSVLMLATGLAASAYSREWVDASGHYHIKAELLARNETTLVLERSNKNKDLIAVAIDQLSEQDREYLASLETETEEGDDSRLQTWTMRRGLKVRGVAVEYARRDITIRRHHGKVYVNDKRFENLPGIYRRMLPEIVAQFENMDLANERELKKWVQGLRGKAKTFTLDGVMLELENGDLYGIPFFFFSEADRAILEPGWEEWLAAVEDEELREQHSLSLQAQAVANRDSELEQRQVAMLQLQLQGYQAGLFSLWEVALIPPNGRGMPLRVVVPGRDSRQASVAALAKYPNYRVGPVSKVGRRF